MTEKDPGTTPPRADAAPSGPAQKHDNETHRTVKSRPRRDVTDRGLLWLETVKVGQEQSLRGSGWPPKKGIVWIRIWKRRAFPRMTGGRSGGRILSDEKLIGEKKQKGAKCDVSIP